VLLTFLLACILLFSLPGNGPSQERSVDILKVDSIINPVVAEFITKNLEAASERKAECVVIELDTPGGLDTSMRSIIKEIMNSPTPVVVYVSPSGARAASAGAIITIAADIGAMAPGTNIGAARPVSLGGGQQSDEMAEKVLNDAAAYVESIAIKRKRNKEWAVKAVRESVSITEQQALELNVIDIIATSIDDLLSQIDGKEVETAFGAKKLSTKGAALNVVEMGWRYNILNALTNPNIAYILMLIGLAGLYFELSNPGVLFPGIIGGICLILAFYAFQTLSVNYAGILLILMALVLFIAEVKVASFGLLAIGGVIALTLGSLMLFESPVPYLRLSLKVLIPSVALVSAFFIVVATLAIRAYQRKPTTGKEGLVGEKGTASTPIDPEGKVFVHGEHWNAESDEPIPEGAKIVVTEVKDLVIKVKEM
jgi:membrane-bound serine protease (ClpP class)